MAGSQDPTTGSTAWSLTTHGISENLFTVDKTGNIVGVLADSVAKVSEFVWTVTLKTEAKFSDGTAVTSQAVADCLTELNEKNSAAQSSLGDMTLTATDATTVQIESTRATHVMDSVLAEWAFAIYKKDGDNFIFTGPYKVDVFVADSNITLAPNTHYHDGKSGERPHHLVVKVYAGGDALAAALKAGDCDVAFHLPVAAVADINTQADVHVKTFEVGYHYMSFYNGEATNVLADVNVRRALDLAIDRSELVKALGGDDHLGGGKATRSFFPDYSPFYAEHGDAKADTAAAAALLDTAGWPLVDGKRTKNGNPLTIRLVAYPQRPGLPIMQPKVAEALEAVGVTVTQITTSADNWDELDGIMADRTWDMLMWAQNTLPAGDPLWFTSHFFRSDGGNNHAKYNSTAVDALIDALSLKEDHAERVAASKAAMAAIIADAPVSQLVSPAWHVGLSNRMVEYEPYGSDYYIINAAFHEVATVEEETTTAAGETITRAEDTDAPADTESSAVDARSASVAALVVTVAAVLV